MFLPDIEYRLPFRLENLQNKFEGRNPLFSLKFSESEIKNKF